MNRLIVFKARRNDREFVGYSNDGRKTYVVVDPDSKLWAQNVTINSALDVLAGKAAAPPEASPPQEPQSPLEKALKEEAPAAEDAPKQPQRPRKPR